MVAVNPYRMFDTYGLDAVSKYEGKIIGTLPPHLFAVGASAYHRLLAKNGENQVRPFNIDNHLKKNYCMWLKLLFSPKRCVLGKDKCG